MHVPTLEARNAPVSCTSTRSRTQHYVHIPTVSQARWGNCILGRRADALAMAAEPRLLSAAFFCPRARPPRDDYVTELRSYLRCSDHGTTLLAHVENLTQAWPLFANARHDIAALPHGLRDLSLLVAWSKGGPVAPVCEARAGMVALPLLLVLQLAQYFRYLEAHKLSHEEFLRQVYHVGGLHGFCGGAAAALSIACAKDEAEVVENAAIFLRIMMGIGAAMEAAGDCTSSMPTTIVVRLKHEGQGEELLKHFPGVSVELVLGTAIY